MQNQSRVVLITSKILEHFGHEVNQYNWQLDESGDLQNRCLNIECRQAFSLFTPFPDLLSCDRVWRVMNEQTYDGFHFNEWMEYQEVKDRVLRTRNRWLYCSPQ